MRLPPDLQQHLLDRYLSSNDSESIEAIHSLKSMAQEVMDRAGLGHLDQGKKYISSILSFKHVITTLDAGFLEWLTVYSLILCTLILGLVGSSTTEAHIPPLLGVAPLGPVPLSRQHHTQLQMLEAAHYHMPVPADSERMRQFLPRNPIPTPVYYPQVNNFTI